MPNVMITSVSWNPRGQAKALPIVAEAKMDEEEMRKEESAMAAPSETRGAMDEDDIVAKYGLENYDEEPGMLREKEGRKKRRKRA